MPGSRNNNTYTCTCTHFCGGYKTGLSWATFYRHAPYRDAAQPSFSSSFQDFLDKSAGQSGAVNHSGLETGQEESQAQGNTDSLDNLGAEFPSQVLGGITQNSGSTVDLETVGVNFPF